MKNKPYLEGSDSERTDKSRNMQGLYKPYCCAEFRTANTWAVTAFTRFITISPFGSSLRSSVCSLVRSHPKTFLPCFTLQSLSLQFWPHFILLWLPLLTHLLALIDHLTCHPLFISLSSFCTVVASPWTTTHTHKNGPFSLIQAAWHKACTHEWHFNQTK